MVFHEKKIIIDIFYMKNLDFGEAGFSDSKISYWENVANFEHPRGCFSLGIKICRPDSKPRWINGQRGCWSPVTALLPTVHNPAGNQVIPVIKLIYNTSNRRVVLKGSQQYWLKSQWDAGEINVAHLIHLEMPLAGSSANPTEWGHGDGVG